MNLKNFRAALVPAIVNVIALAFLFPILEPYGKALASLIPLMI